MQTVLEDTHVLKENVDCIAVYQNIAIPISTVTGNIRLHIMPKYHTYVNRILGSPRNSYYSDVSIKNIDILPNRQYIANTADSAQEQYS